MLNLASPSQLPFIAGWSVGIVSDYAGTGSLTAQEKVETRSKTAYRSVASGLVEYSGGGMVITF